MTADIWVVLLLAFIVYELHTLIGQIEALRKDVRRYSPRPRRKVLSTDAADVQAILDAGKS